MSVDLDTAGRATGRPAAHSPNRRWAKWLVAGGAISFAAGASVLALGLSPMFLPAPIAAPIVGTIAGSLGLGGEGSTVVAPTPSAQPPSAVEANVPATGSKPVDGVSFEIRIPAIGYQALVRQGVSLYVLAGGPGHYPGTPWPGQVGNVGVAGHNTFWLSFNRLKAGDQVMLQTEQQVFVYQVTGSRIVDPSDRTVLAATQDRRLTMTTCWPLWAGVLATKRLIFTAIEVG